MRNAGVCYDESPKVLALKPTPTGQPQQGPGGPLAALAKQRAA